MYHLTFLAAFLIGLFSAIHCLGMCGGIIGALTLSLPRTVREDRLRLLGYVLSYNMGRIVSYALAGATLGGLGSKLFALVSPRYGHMALQTFAAALMIGIGLYLAGWFPGLARLETLGAPLWRRIEPLGRRLLPVRSPAQALLFGMVWGWLPCGLVYTVLAWAAAAGSPRSGALLLTGFGLGTLPAVLGAGVITGWALRLARTPLLRHLVGVAIILIALATLVVAGATQSHPIEHLLSPETPP